jgi:hypothetical protein
MYKLNESDFGESQQLTRDEAMQRVGNLPLDIPIEGIRADSLDQLITWKQAEVKRNSVLARAKGGVLEGTMQFTTGLATSLADPLNIASAFIPVFGQAKYASMLAKAGTSVGQRALVRAQVGAVEGVVGAAMLEPIILASASQTQSDYGLMDSTLNLVFGGLMGGGLHASLGVLADRRGKVTEAVTNAAPETRESALRAAVAQTMSGQKIDVSHILDADPWYSYTAGRSVDKPSAAALETRVGEAVRDVTAQLDLAESKLLTRGQQASIEARVKSIESAIADPAKAIREAKAADPELGNKPPDVVKQDILTRLEAERADLVGQLTRQERMRADIAQARTSAGEASEKIIAGERISPETTHRTVRDAVRKELESSLRATDKQRFAAAEASTRKQGDYRNEWDYDEALDTATMRSMDEMRGKDDAALIDEELDALEQDMMDNAQALGITEDEVAGLDALKSELDAELAEAQTILNGLKACQRTAA